MPGTGRGAGQPARRRVGLSYRVGQVEHRASGTGFGHRRADQDPARVPEGRDPGQPAFHHAEPGDRLRRLEAAGGRPPAAPARSWPPGSRRDQLLRVRRHQQPCHRAKPSGRREGASGAAPAPDADDLGAVRRRAAAAGGELSRHAFRARGRLGDDRLGRRAFPCAADPAPRDPRHDRGRGCGTAGPLAGRRKRCPCRHRHGGNADGARGICLLGQRPAVVGDGARASGRSPRLPRQHRRGRCRLRASGRLVPAGRDGPPRGRKPHPPDRGGAAHALCPAGRADQPPARGGHPARCRLRPFGGRGGGGLGQRRA